MQGLKLKYFVLNPTSSDVAFREASRAALAMFSEEIEDANPVLAEDINQWLSETAEKEGGSD